MNSCIMVFGVSGVGKTTACKTFVSDNPSFAYIGAGKLLSEMLGMSKEQMLSLTKQQVYANQKALGQEITRITRLSPGRKFLVDGHAVICLRQSLIKVPTSVFAAIAPLGLCLLEERPDVIAARRVGSGAVTKYLSISEIEKEIKAERRAFLQLSAQLRLRTIIMPDYSSLVFNGGVEFLFSKSEVDKQHPRKVP